MAPELLTASDLGAEYAPEPLKLMAPRYRAERLPCGAFNRAPRQRPIFSGRRFRSIIEAANEIERNRELPPSIVSALIDNGLFRLLQSRSLDELR